MTGGKGVSLPRHAMPRSPVLVTQTIHRSGATAAVAPRNEAISLFKRRISR